MSISGGFGVVFKIGDDEMSGSPSYTEIAEVETFNGFAIGAVMAEATTHGSTGGFREKIPSGLFEVDDVELTLVFDISEATHANAAGGLTHALLNKTKLAYQIVLPDTGSTTFTYDAYVNKITWTSETEETIKAVVTQTITGQPTLT